MPVTSAPAIQYQQISKRFGDTLAVDHFSLSVQPGQVFGLLGPNGAGKTTLLRMLLGLVHPTAGEAWLLGQRVHPGDPILRRAGALVEGPGFVPHLSGIKNLEYFWRAGGTRIEDAHIKEALAVAGLGAAINRKVRTYSTGMRQRLGIAQALLGRPSVLVLDEPTAGLDPEETRGIRELMRDVTSRGATVLLSSHILAEVEQVCTHVAVMNHGQLIKTGSVSELIGATARVYLETDDQERSMLVLASLEGVRDLRRETGGLSFELDGIRRRDVVAAVVRADIGVETVTSRHGLEDAFLRLVEGQE